jgi:hypothetical protein
MSESEHPPGPDLVLLRKFRDLPDALLAKSLLDAEKIDCFLADENTIRMDWLWSNLLGGFKLWVKQEDAQQALALLDQAIVEQFDLEGVGEFKQPHCPNCQSLDIWLESFDKRGAAAGLLVGLPVAIATNRWHCQACGHQWSKTDETAETAVNPSV